MVHNKDKAPRGRPRQFDPAQVLDKAAGVFWERGYEGADTQTLSVEMGLTKPSIYSAFGAKEDLFLHALTRYGETIGQAPVQALLDSPTPQDGVLAFFQTVAESVSGQHNPTGCLIACVGMPAAERMPKVATYLKASLADAEALIADHLEEMVATDALPATFEIPTAVRLMFDLMFAMGLRGRLGWSRKQLDTLAKENTAIVLGDA